MVNSLPRLSSHPITYKVKVRLATWQWERLEAECRDRGIPGEELIAAVLSQYIHRLPPRGDAPTPEGPEGEEGETSC